MVVSWSFIGWWNLCLFSRISTLTSRRGLNVDSSVSLSECSSKLWPHVSMNTCKLRLMITDIMQQLLSGPQNPANPEVDFSQIQRAGPSVVLSASEEQVTRITVCFCRTTDGSKLHVSLGPIWRSCGRGGAVTRSGSVFMFSLLCYITSCLCLRVECDSARLTASFWFMSL